MRIVLLHYTAPPVVGGVESVLAHQARRMAAAGHRVTVLAGRGSAFDEGVELRLLPLLDSRHPEVLEAKRALDRGSVPPGFEALRERIASGLRQELEGARLLIAHNVASLHKNLALTAALQASSRAPGFPRLVLWHHDLAWAAPRYRPELHPGLPWELLRSPWPGAVHVAVSQTRRRELAALTGLAEADIRVIPNGVDPAAFFKLEPLTARLVEQLHLVEADPLFLLPARLTPRKNIELALQVLAELRKDLQGAVLLVTGPEGPHNPANREYKRRLLELRAGLGLERAAVFLAELVPGFLPDPVVSDFYRLADALLFPSLEEGFGIPVIEAAFSGLPVFCADLPVLRELGGEDLSYFRPEEAPSVIAARIRERLEREATVRWARRARRQYAWDSIYARQIAPLLEEVSG